MGSRRVAQDNRSYLSPFGAESNPPTPRQPCIHRWPCARPSGAKKTLLAERRNVLDHLTDEQKPAVAKRLNAAHALEDYADAKKLLDSLHRELMDLNPSAARSLGEGMEETLTVHHLQVPLQLRATLASTRPG